MKDTLPRDRVLGEIADLLCNRRLAHPLRVAIDGIDAAGKSTLANELAPLVESRGHSVIRASVDGFHRPRTERYARGPLSPEGYYGDSFNYSLVRSSILEPLGPCGNREYCIAVFDHVIDSPVVQEPSAALPDSVLLFDGVFLSRSELVDCWDFRIFVQVDFSIALRRALARDAGDVGELTARYLKRYFPAQQIYLAEVEPLRHSDLIFNNTDLANPSYLLRSHIPLTP